MKKRERELFYAIATYAINNGYRVSLERENSIIDSEALSGIISNTKSTNRGLILRVKPPKESEAGDDQT